MRINGEGIRIVSVYDEYSVTPVITAEKAVKRYVSAQLNEDQFSALVSFVTSVTPKEFKNSRLLMLVNKGQFLMTREWFDEFTADENGKEDKKLVKRRRDEKRLFFKPQLVGGQDGRQTKR